MADLTATTLIAPGLIHQQPPRLNVQRCGQLSQYNDGRVSDAPLNAANVGPMQPTLEGEGLLR